MNYGLAPRPELPREEMAVVIAAVEEILLSQAVQSPIDAVPSWRFSGRWFNSGPYANRRPQRSM